MAEKNNELLIKNHQSRPTGSTAFQKQMLHFLKIMDEDIIMVMAVDVVVAVDMAVDAVEVIFTTLHKTTRSTRNIMQKDIIKEKMFMKVLFRILKIPIINVAPKGTGLVCAKHRSTFVSFTRHP